MWNWNIPLVFYSLVRNYLWFSNWKYSGSETSRFHVPFKAALVSNYCAFLRVVNYWLSTNCEAVRQFQFSDYLNFAASLLPQIWLNFILGRNLLKLKVTLATYLDLDSVQVEIYAVHCLWILVQNVFASYESHFRYFRSNFPPIKIRSDLQN